MTYRIEPINVATITQAVVDQLKADAPLIAAQVDVSRSEDQNVDPNTPRWVGVYRLSVEYPQRHLVSVAGFRGQVVRLAVIVSQSDPNSGQDCEDRLEELLMLVMAAILSDTTLRGTVQNLDEFNVFYTRYSRESGGPFSQTAQIEFAAITNTTISGG